MSRGFVPPQQGDPGGEVTGVAAREQPAEIEAVSAPTRRVLVTGATGFIATHLLPRLESRGHRVRAGWRGRESPAREAAPGVEWHRLDVTLPETLRGAAAECDVVVHLAGCRTPPHGTTLAHINVAGTRNVLVAAAEAGVERLVYVSALGASPVAGDVFRTRFQAEDAVLSSGLEYVILRPGVVYGPGDHFVSAILRLLRSLPAFPMLGDGTFRLQPLAVEDMVDALTQSVERPDVEGGLYELAGPDQLSFTRIVRTVGEVAGCRKPVVPLPDLFAGRAVGLARKAGMATPFTSEQLDVLRGISVLSGRDNPLRSVFRVKPLPFRDALEDYLAVDPNAGEGGRA